jgi:MOSC domain-containing protein YiiM
LAVGTLTTVNLAVERRDPWVGSLGRSGIDKRPVPSRVRVTALGLEGDLVANRQHHGGKDQAVYAYARSDAAWWATELGRDLPPGRFGENLSTEELDVTGALIGERWRIGEVLLEVRRPRIPCTIFAGFWDVPDLIKRFTARGAPGAYLGVLAEGEIGAGDVIEVTHRPAHGLTIGQTFQALTTRPDLMPLLLTAPELPAKLRAKAERRTAHR